MDLTCFPNLAEGLLASAGARLQHLQLVLADDSRHLEPVQLWTGFWRAVKAFPDLATLQLVLRPNCFDGPIAGEKVVPNQPTMPS